MLGESKFIALITEVEQTCRPYRMGAIGKMFQHALATLRSCEWENGIGLCVSVR